MSPFHRCLKLVREQGLSGATGLEGIPQAAVLPAEMGVKRCGGGRGALRAVGPSPAWRVHPRPAMMDGACLGTLGRDVDTPTPPPAP